MAYDFNGSNQHMSAAATITATPCTLAAWVYPDTITGARAIIAVDASVFSDWFAIYTVATTGVLRASTVTGGVESAANSSVGVSTGTWAHCCGVFASDTSRTAYVNGGNSGSNTVSRTPNPAQINATRIGTRTFNSSQGLFFDGRIAEVGIWNAALTADEIASLAKGMTCDKVRPQSLVFYAPLVRNLIDTKGGLTITNNNSATVANHPRVYA